MDKVIAVIQTALPVFLALGLGMLCRSRNFLSREGVDALKKVVINLTLPFVLLNAFATAEYSISALILPALMFSICCLALGLGFLAVRIFKIKGKLTAFLASGFEAGMLGYALFALLFPGEGSAAFAIIDLGQVLFVFTLYKALLAGKGGLKGVVAEAAHAPTVWAILAGIAVGASGLYRALEPVGVSGVLDAVAGFIAAPTSTVILLTIGYDLLPEEIQFSKTARLVGLRLGVSAAALLLAVLANRFLLGGMMHTGALVLMFTLPPPYVLPVFADVEEERTDISSALSVLTLVSLLLFMAMTVVYA